MTEPKRILVVVDPTAKEHPALDRAAWLAKRLPARLELFICDYDTHLSQNQLFDSASLAKARASLMENHVKRLRALAAPLMADNLEVTVDARWDHPLHDGIVRKTLDAGAALVVKDTHYHSVLKRSIFSNTDWDLIRNCPADLWLVKPQALETPPRFLAAVDPLHERDKPAELDHRILKTAEHIAAAVGAELHVCHAFDVAPVLAVSTDSLTMPISLPIAELTESMRKEHTAAVHGLTDAHAIPLERVHIRQCGARELLVTLTGELNADVVVMGAVSRSGLKRLFLGNTAEEVLDKLPCDLLIVKPAGFEAALPS
jgi:universal stress protein E